MTIDLVSQKIITLALYLDQLQAGRVAELWLSQDLIDKCRVAVPGASGVSQLVAEIKSLLPLLESPRRQLCLIGLLNSILFQINEIETHQSRSLAEFTQNCFGYRVSRVGQAEIHHFQQSLAKAEAATKLQLAQVINRHTVPQLDLAVVFSSYAADARSAMERKFELPAADKFELELTSAKPWIAFNEHVAPYYSRMLLNQDIALTDYDLKRLAVHEGYGGHHLELTLKDDLLVRDGFGEHGIVLTYSPQSFISEGLAESAIEIWGVKEEETPETLLIAAYNRLVLALQNYSVYRYIEDQCAARVLQLELGNLGLLPETVQLVMNFTLDPVLGRYALVYHSAREFFGQIYRKARDRDGLLREVYTRPCTPGLLQRYQHNLLSR